MNKEIEIPEGYEARVEGNKIILEPKESEDERIRKWIIDELKDSLHGIEAMYSGDYDNRDEQDKERQAYLNKALAYLEKQKDEAQKQFNLGVQAGREEVLYEMEKEEKSIEDVVKKITQNKETAIKFLKSAGIMDDNGELAEMYRSEQRSTEWSEEDDMRIKHLTTFVEKYGLNYYASTDKVISWLKSLRPQLHWKPSEEQMRCLEFAIKQLERNYLIGPGRAEDKGLYQLVNDLKLL